MAPAIFVTGGARSGKSAYAQQRAEQFSGSLLYVAACRVEDDEMARRVALHQAARGPRWQTLEEPLALVEALSALAPGTGAVLLDCLTLWLSNLLLAHGEDDAAILAEARRLAELLPCLEVPLVLVSNEVGAGIVPEHPLARRFRDLAGSVNQVLAAAADEAWLVVAGLPLRLK